MVWHIGYLCGWIAACWYIGGVPSKMSSRPGGREWIAAGYLGKRMDHASERTWYWGKTLIGSPPNFGSQEKDYAEISEHVPLFPSRLHPFDARYKTSAHYLIKSSMFPTLDTLHIG
ncbi:hypothetical protein ARMGADRAFT_823077 [Armillaria gallica]|uniref:Uncharacterized protein n=1 Tax=Armillaria gallica TaxID=47427 RepID=A0A2H3CVH1_ARMGA|nr:hypothetical protein ARMGADRAFT_823077 [Armillaria gallica]